MTEKPRFFRDFNWANKLLLAVALLLLLLIVGYTLAHRNWQRQQWAVVVCAQQPGEYVFRSGSLRLNNGHYLALEKDQPEPGSDPRCATCGEAGYEPEYRLLLPPDSLLVEWASLPEHQFYRGRFGLPKKLTDSLFARYESWPDTTGGKAAGFGLVFTVRLAPNGRVSLGVLEADKNGTNELDSPSKELVSFQAAAYQPTWGEEATYDRNYQAPSPQAYLDTLVSRIDSVGRFRTAQ